MVLVKVLVVYFFYKLFVKVLFGGGVVCVCVLVEQCSFQAGLCDGWLLLARRASDSIVIVTGASYYGFERRST